MEKVSAFRGEEFLGHGAFTPFVVFKRLMAANSGLSPRCPSLFIGHADSLKLVGVYRV